MNLTTVLFVNFLCLNKQNVKSVLWFTFCMQRIYTHSKKTCKNLVERPLVKHDFYNTNLGRKVNSQLQNHITKQLLTSLSVEIRKYLLLK